jgi:hypothetical protein
MRHGTLMDRSHDVNQSWEVRPELGYPTGVGHTIKVVSSNWSRAYNQDHVFQSEPGDTCIISMYNR